MSKTVPVEEGNKRSANENMYFVIPDIHNLLKSGVIRKAAKNHFCQFPQ